MSHKKLLPDRQFFRQSVESAPDAIYWINTKAEILKVNQVACRQLGYTMDALTGMTIYNLNPELSLEKWQQYCRELQEQKTISFRSNHLRRDGSWLPVEINANHFVLDKQEFICAFVRDISSRVQVEEKLGNSENRYRQLYQGTPVMMHSVDDQMRLLDVNQRWTGVMGYSSEEVLGRPAYEFVSKKSREFVREKGFPDLMKTGEIRDIEVEMCKKNGETFDVQLSATAEFDGDGNLIRSMAFLIDVNERNRASQALESRLKIETLISELSKQFINLDAEQIEDGIQWGLQKIGEFAGVDRCYLFQLDHAKEIAVNTLEWCNTDVEPQIEHLQNVGFSEISFVIGKIKGQETIHIPDIKALPDSLQAEREHWLAQDICSLLTVPVGFDGRVAGFIGFDSVNSQKYWLEEDVRLLKVVAEMIGGLLHRQASTEALRSSQDRLSRLARLSSAIIFHTNPDGATIYINERWREITGRPTEEAMAFGWLKYVCEDDRDRLIYCWKQAVADQSGFSLEFRLKTPDGGFAWMFGEVQPEFDNKGRVISYIGTVLDISDRRQTEIALQESEERLGRILESAMDAIVAIDSDRRIVMANHAAEKTFGMEGRPLGGQSIDPFLSGDLKEFIVDYISGTGFNPEATATWLPEGLKAIGADGKDFAIEATISQVTIRQQRIFTLILRNVDQIRIAQETVYALRNENEFLKEELQNSHDFEEIVGDAPVMKKVFRNIEMVASTDSTVLLTGETGTGKELLARAIHQISERKDRVMIKINCGALPAGLVESELFGHEKGAFTGATTQKKGRFELANQGTIFLDEIGELPLETQTKLLRVLQEQEFERVGGTRTLKVNARVIAATNRDLESEVKRGSFRADLYYRLNIFPINVPPLRERMQDIPLLASYFINKFSRQMGRRVSGISPRAMDKLQRCDWPGNVRELANILERAVILCQGRILQAEHIQILPAKTDHKGFYSLEEAEKQHILEALQKSGGILAGPNGAAELLRVNRSTLWSRMRKLGINSSSVNATV